MVATQSWAPSSWQFFVVDRAEIVLAGNVPKVADKLRIDIISLSQRMGISAGKAWRKVPRWLNVGDACPAPDEDVVGVALNQSCCRRVPLV